MRMKTMLLTAAALTVLMSSSAFAGTWKMGTGENQGKWWYDNDNGTYAQNGWQWIDDNGDSVAECYYFDANGWMYADTTTPDGFQVNASGAWVENGVVKTNAVPAAVGWFDAAGLQANALQNVGYDYLTDTYDLPQFKTTGCLTFRYYNTFESDLTHPAQEGYEWKTVWFDIAFKDDFAQAYGASWAYSFGNKDKLELVNDWNGDEHTFTLNYNGKEYTNCKLQADTEFFGEEDGLYLDGHFTCCVPKGYQGMFVAFYDNRLYSQVVANGEPAYIEALRNAVIFPFN